MLQSGGMMHDHDRGHLRHLHAGMRTRLLASRALAREASRAQRQSSSREVGVLFTPTTPSVGAVPKCVGAVPVPCPTASRAGGPVLAGR